MKLQRFFGLIGLSVMLTIFIWATGITYSKEKAYADSSDSHLYRDKSIIDWIGADTFAKVQTMQIESKGFRMEKAGSILGGAGMFEINPIGTSTQNFNFSQIGGNQSVVLHTSVNQIDTYSFAESLNIAIEDKSFGMRSLTPTQTTPVVSVIFEKEFWMESGGRLKMSPGHVGIRVDNTIYEIEKTSHGSGIYKTRNYEDIFKDNRGQLEVVFNIMTPDQIKELETNLKQRVELKEPFDYDFFNRECANMVEDEFARIGLLFPNNFFEIPRNTFNQAKILNQTNKAPMTNWEEKSNLYSGFSSSGDLKRTLQRAGKFKKFSLINKVGELPAVKSYLNSLGNEMDNLRAVTPASLIDAYFETVDFDSASFTRGARGPSFRGIDDYLSKGPSTFSAIDNLDFSTSFNSINIK